VIPRHPVIVKRELTGGPAVDVAAPGTLEVGLLRPFADGGG
jgi:hypothetical protein